MTVRIFIGCADAAAKACVPTSWHGGCTSIDGPTPQTRRLAMVHGTARRAALSPVSPSRRSQLFKPDRPRTIDRYIDYFGGRPGRTGPSGPCDAMDADEAVNALPRAASN